MRPQKTNLHWLFANNMWNRLPRVLGKESWNFVCPNFKVFFRLLCFLRLPYFPNKIAPLCSCAVSSMALKSVGE